MKIQLNMTNSDDDLSRYGSPEALRSFLEDFDGVELISCEEKPMFRIPVETVTGLHTTGFPYWYDFYRGDTESCLREYGDRETMERVYGGSTPEALVRHYRNQFELARKYRAEYMVVHASDCTFEEALRNVYRHTDGEIAEGLIDLMNEALPSEASEEDPWLLLENLWEPGLTFLNPEIGHSLISRIRYQKTGFMLDTGHLMNTNPMLETPEEALDYIRAILDRCGSLTEHIRGIHLNQSLSGSFVRQYRQNVPELKKDYGERFCQMFTYVFRADEHKPFCCDGVESLIERIHPDYLTFEFISTGPEELKNLTELQKSSLPGLFPGGKRANRV